MLSEIDAVLRATALLLPVREATGHNDGRFVNAIQASTGNAAGDPWCQSATYYVGRGVLGTRWPVPATGGCQVALAWYRRRALERATPAVGDQFFVLGDDGIAHHTGFVEWLVGDGSWRSLEGNTNDDGSREGIGEFRRLRGGPSDHTSYTFGRWADALTAPPAA